MLINQLLNFQMTQNQKYTNQLHEEFQMHSKQMNQVSNIEEEQSNSANSEKQNMNDVMQVQIKNAHASSYRPDIDGLRTVAVGIVIIFHAWPEFMPGGFIGVDIFFVISGYLISGIIIKESLRNAFSYVDFYSRRIRRIYPALLLMLIVILFLSCWKLLDRSLNTVTKTMAASSVFGANFQILQYQNGYWDPQVKKNPLLHLWSLGVEQQFYIIWPCLLAFLLHRLSSKKMILSLSIFTIASFILNIVVVNRDPKQAFYFPLCRFWQMSIGGLIAYTNIKITNNILANVMSSLGISSVFVLVWILDEDKLFPGWWALIPTLGAALIIMAGNQAAFNRKVLSSEIFVFIGKISYPLYLWHWPLLVITRLLYPIGSQSVFTITPFILFLTFAASVATYFLIQKNMRFFTSRKIVIVLLGMMFSLGLFSFYISKTRKQQFSWKQKKIKDYLNQIEEIAKFQVLPGPDDFYVKNGKKLPNSSKNPKRQNATVPKVYYAIDQFSDLKLKSILNNVTQSSKYYKQVNKWVKLQSLNQGKQNQLFVIGDSHGWHTTHRFRQLYEQSLIENKQSQFPSVLSVITLGQPFLPCNPLYDTAMQLISEHNPKRILFVNDWLHYMKFTKSDGPLTQNKPSHTNTFEQCWFGTDFHHIKVQSLQDVQYDLNTYKNLMKDLVDRGFQVYVVKLHLQGDQLDPHRMIDQNGIIEGNINPIRLSEWIERNKFSIDLFENALKDTGVKMIDFNDHHCWQDICHVLIPTGYPTKLDTNHYTMFYNKHWVSSVDFLVEF